MVAETPLSGPKVLKLDKHEELSTPPRIRCSCGPRFLRLRADDGELVQPRGGCVNRCESCARLQAVENSEMLSLDAMEGNAPRVWCVLSTRTATIEMEPFYKARAKLFRALRRRWPDVEYCCVLEFTTGYANRSGGERRPHWNVLLKGVGPEDVPRIRALVDKVWCGQVDAEPQGQHVGPVAEAGGLMKYLALHFQKESQAPPRGFHGQRVNCSHGYFGSISVAVARRRAKESLRLKREVWGAETRLHMGPEAALCCGKRIYRAQLRRIWVLTNDRGARLGAMGHDGRRMALPSDRRRDAEMRAGLQRVSPLAGTSGVGVLRARRARLDAEAEALRAIRESRLHPLSLFALRLSGLQGEEAEGAVAVTYPANAGHSSCKSISITFDGEMWSA